MADNLSTTPGGMTPQQMQALQTLFGGAGGGGAGGTNPSNDMGQFLGWLASAFNLTSGNNNNNTQQAVNLADPNAKHAGSWSDMLDTALTKPGSYDRTPGAEFAKEQGLEAVARHGNAMFGTSASGGTAVELEKYATGFAEQNYNSYIDQLTKLTGGNNAAGAMLLTGKNQGNTQIGTLMSGLGSILQAAGINPQMIQQIIQKMSGTLSPNETPLPTGVTDPGASPGMDFGGSSGGFDTGGTGLGTGPPEDLGWVSGFDL